MLAAGVGVTLLLAAAGVAWSISEVGAARAELDRTRATTVALQARQAEYADVPRVLARVDAAKAARAQALAQDVDWSPFLTDLATALPSSVWLTNLQLAVQAGARGGAADALTPAGIGDLTVTGGAKTFPDVSAWLQAVVKVRGLDGSTLQTATRQQAGSGGGSTVQFTSRVQLTGDALTHRFDRKVG
jgi:Tfp pilus assembly protein PilN